MAFGLDHVIVRDIDVTNPASIRSLGGYSLSKGKTMIVAEAGRSGTMLTADVNALISGSLNVLGALLVLGAVADMRDALHDRIDRGDIDDLSLEPDCRNWCNLARALADFLTVRRSA